MGRVQVNLPAELLEAAGVNPADASRDATLLLALELYRENKLEVAQHIVNHESPRTTKLHDR